MAGMKTLDGGQYAGNILLRQRCAEVDVARDNRRAVVDGGHTTDDETFDAGVVEPQN